MLEAYLNRNKYKVVQDLEEKKLLHKLYLYKKETLKQNGYEDFVKNLPDTTVKFSHVEVDDDGIEQAVDVSDVYPVSLEDERREIERTAENLVFLRNTNRTFEHCRTKCKILDTRMRNLVAYPRERQMCLTDCMNIKFEFNNMDRPGDDKTKTFVWLA